MVYRSAVTLIEVLVSIFIMGIGMMSLMTLFVLGSLTMAQAIKDDRVAQAAANAEAVAVLRDVRNDFSTTSAEASSEDRAFKGPTGWPDLRTIRGGLDGPSYPIYVDPLGVLGLTGNTAQSALGAYPAMNSPGIPRRKATFATTGPTALRWFSLLDEVEFTEDGRPKELGGAVQRQTRYSWAYLLRRPKASVASVVDLSVVVYNGRPLLATDVEPAYGPVVFNVDSSEVLVTWDPATQEKPPVRKGGWVLDATVVNASGGPEPHGFFHRVVNVTELPPQTGRPALMLELEPRPRLNTNHGVLVVMQYVVEVVEKAGDWKP